MKGIQPFTLIRRFEGIERMEVKVCIKSFLIQRIDDVVNTYECFVGLMAGSEKQIIIREAGANCFKTIDVQHYGMEMNQTGNQNSSTLNLNLIVLFRFQEKCRVHETNDGEAEVAPTQDGHSITYETVFDDENNNLDINTLTSTRKTKSKRNFSERESLTMN